MMDFYEAYPKNKLEEVENHLRKVWAGEIKGTYSCISMEPNYRQMEDESQAPRLAAQCILDNARYPGYNPPRVTVDFGTVSMPQFWGGTVKLPVGGCKSIEPIIHGVEDLEQICPADPESLDAAKGIELYRNVCRILKTDDLYCTTFDFQGPLTTAAMLWDQTDFMVSMCTEPEEVHRFLDHVTDHIIKVMKTYVKNANHMVCGNTWPFIWLPSDIGMGITEDYMPLISSDMYREFGIPYVERISREFGGLFIHCCGSYEHQLENLKNSDINILGLEFHYPYTKPQPLFETFGDSCLFLPYISISQNDEFKSYAEYFSYLKEIKKPETRLWFILDPNGADFKDQLRVVQDIVGE